MWKPKGDSSGVVRKNRIGQSLLVVSFAIWFTSVFQIYVLSPSVNAGLFVFAICGGCLAGVVGTLRSLSIDTPRNPIWHLTNLAKSLFIGGLIYFILSAKADPGEARWVTFFFGVMAYVISRDIVQTIATASAVTAANRKRQARHAARRAKLAALAAKLGEPAPDAIYPTGSSAIQLL